MKRYSVKVTQFGQPDYIPGTRCVELFEDEEGQLVKWEDVKYYLNLFNVIEKLALSDRDFDTLKEYEE